MAIQVLASGGYGDACQWSIDWDSTGRNIGITVDGVASEFFVEVQGPFGDFVADCVHGPATQAPDATGTYLLGNIIGAGRTIVVGPGSVIGQTTRINSINWKTTISAVGTRWTP